MSLAASRDRFKVFILDEVHMLSDSSFNALLKTIEEPPSHVVFILATTEKTKCRPRFQAAAKPSASGLLRKKILPRTLPV
ncbi:hypothetical protein [Elusimicrobium simillimum]|uniref:hypothetical protein n=1 Tax=Elusimicrobium simillimum TaxID=3143438 RepID=UPI003C6F0E6A